MRRLFNYVAIRAALIVIYFFCCSVCYPSEVAPGYLAQTIKAFQSTNGSSNAADVASYIDIFKIHGKSSQDVINLICLKLKENDPLYHDRGPKEVERLRGYILASLSEIGINHQVIPIVKAELAFGYQPYIVAAAARLAGYFPEPHQAPFVSLLGRYLDDAFKDDNVDIDHYGIIWPLKNPTSVRAEVISSLEKIGKSDPKAAISALSPIADPKAGSFFQGKSDLVSKARSALVKITSATSASGAVVKNSMPICCAAPSATIKSGAVSLNGAVKVGYLIKNFRAFDQDGNVFQSARQLGKPFALTFFYTRCDNPNKCSANVRNLGALRKTLDGLEMGNKVSLFAISYEPGFDAPGVMKGYGEGRGITFDNSFKFLVMNQLTYSALIKDLGVLVNYGKGMVNNHGTQLYLFDRRGRLAKIYENTTWTDEEVVRDFKLLLKSK